MAEPGELPLSLEVTFDGEVEPDRLLARLHRIPLGAPARIEPVPGAKGGGRKAVFEGTAKALCSGRNIVDLRYTGYSKDMQAITVLAVELRVR